jgi:Transposase DDE domain/Transposase domain (DUF772)
VQLYGHCLEVRSSRQLERRRYEDIASRVLAGNSVPDHVTIARFRVRNEDALAGFLVAALKLCAAAGMVQVGTVASDGTKLAGSAAGKADRTQEKLEAEVAEICARSPRPTSARTASNLTEIPNAPNLYIPPAKHGRQGKPRKDGKPSASKSDGLRAAMRAKLASDQGKARYSKRLETVEPVFGQIKEQQGARRFMRRGMTACDAGWKHPQPAQALAAHGRSTSGHAGHRLSDHQGEVSETTTSAVDQPPRPSPEASERSGDLSDKPARRLSNSLCSVRTARTVTAADRAGGGAPPSRPPVALAGFARPA